MIDVKFQGESRSSGNTTGQRLGSRLHRFIPNTFSDRIEIQPRVYKSECTNGLQIVRGSVTANDARFIRGGTTMEKVK